MDSLFGVYRNEPILGTAFGNMREDPQDTFRGLSELRCVTDQGSSLAKNDLRDQFFVFQFGDNAGSPIIIDPSEAKPKKTGSDENPDMQLSIQLSAFHINQLERNENSGQLATLRLDIGKDDNSNSTLDALFWSVAAGIQLFASDNKALKPKDLGADFSLAFSKRPIEIPGSLSRLSFEVVQHQEPPWWKRVFKSLQNPAAEAAISAIGFPGITKHAISMIDQLVGFVGDQKPQVLYKSRPMTLALTEKARSEFAGGIAGIKVGILNPGWAVLVRGADYEHFRNKKLSYYAAHGLLVPEGKDVLERDYFANVTYAVIRVMMRETKLNPQLSL